MDFTGLTCAFKPSGFQVRSAFTTNITVLCDVKLCSGWKPTDDVSKECTASRYKIIPSLNPPVIRPLCSTPVSCWIIA
jgi:hypothetical protein